VNDAGTGPATDILPWPGRRYPTLRSALVDSSDRTVPGRWLSCT
jgi:hypothetical protein